ncbi:tetratricopeptide repeat protein [Reinekea marinisedimentorum]|uniref:Tetratricopeptide repeat protein n=2 Tax=Reinekea marinisedimentorum TaxID=230495 RepID=A0A4V2UK15_9GAMM|nr:tetratricopeptide repeat protein [Reinekea marinisedimentorum]
MEQALKKYDHWSDHGSEQALNHSQLVKLEKQALKHYETSLEESTRNEDSVAHRHQAKIIANELATHQKTKVSALNLLARIALDEGFYPLASRYLEQALSNDPNSAGCWYSLGHVYLAVKDYDQAMLCFSKSLDISPKQTRAATSLAYTLDKKGHKVAAFQAYRKLYHVHPSDDHVQAKLFELLQQIKADFYQQDLEDDVVRWLQLSNVNYQKLAPLAISLITHKYDLTDPNAIVDLQSLAVDKLFNLALGKIYFTDITLEQTVIEIRKQVLLNLIACDYHDKKLLTLATNLALHSNHNEYLYLYDDTESEILRLLKSAIENALRNNANADALEPMLTLYGMYESPAQIKQISKLTAATVSHWSAQARQYLQLSVFEFLNEQKEARQLSSVNKISDQISLAVKEQYEENPYPRWLHLGYNTPTNYGRALEQELVNFRAPDFFNMGTIKILIAGCGTGQHALRVAKYFRNVEVTAIDITKRSLIYAKRKADEYNIQNIKFLNLDILHLDALDEQFHVIECSGVLHHMQNPAAGLAHLKSKLLPKGLIKLGLYSEQARSSIQSIRQLINAYAVPTTRQSIRSMRQAIINNKLPLDNKGILESQDFYSSSGCRDLLFHAQELLFTPQGLSELIREQEMDFLGFVLTSEVKQKYAGEYPNDEKMTNLQNWQAFERQHPQTFSRMYQFYLQ